MNTLRYISILIFSVFSIVASAQTSYLFKGVVKDSIADEPIPYASIYVVGTKTGVVASVNGQFSFHSKSKHPEIRLQAVGYANKVVKLKGGNNAEKRGLHVVIDKDSWRGDY